MLSTLTPWCCVILWNAGPLLVLYLRSRMKLTSFVTWWQWGMSSSNLFVGHPSSPTFVTIRFIRLMAGVGGLISSIIVAAPLAGIFPGPGWGKMNCLTNCWLRDWVGLTFMPSVEFSEDVSRLHSLVKGGVGLRVRVPSC